MQSTRVLLVQLIKFQTIAVRPPEQVKSTKVWDGTAGCFLQITDKINHFPSTYISSAAVYNDKETIIVNTTNFPIHKKGRNLLLFCTVFKIEITRN